MISFWTNSCLQKVRPGKENKTDDTEEKETAVREQIFTQTCGRRKKCFQENQNSLDFLLGKSCLCDASQCIKPYFSWMPHDFTFSFLWRQQGHVNTIWITGRHVHTYLDWEYCREVKILTEQQFVFFTQCVLETGNDTDTDMHRW